MTAEMDDALDAGSELFDRGVSGKVGCDEFLVWFEIVRLADVAPADRRIQRGKQLAHARADAAGGAGNQDFFHGSLFTLCRCPARRMAKRLLDAGLGSEFLIAGAAVDQVALHGVARHVDRVVADGGENFAVLLLEQVELTAFGGRGRAARRRCGAG